MLDRSQSPYNAGRRSPSPINRDAYVRQLFQQSTELETNDPKKVYLRNNMKSLIDTKSISEISGSHRNFLQQVRSHSVS